MLLTSPAREYVQELLSSSEKTLQETPGRGTEGRRIRRLDLLEEVRRTMEEQWTYSVKGAVEKGVAFRLPHELDNSANCGERAVVLYGAAQELGFRNPQFLLYTTDQRRGTTHASVIFNDHGRAYLANPSHSITPAFEIRPRRICIGSKNIPHSGGLQHFSEGELREFIAGLRGKVSLSYLFESGQYLVQEVGREGMEEIFLTLNRERESSFLPWKREAPTLEMLFVHEEPYCSHTAIGIVTSLRGERRRTNGRNVLDTICIDPEILPWGYAVGTTLGVFGNVRENDAKMRVELCSVDELLRENKIKEIIAFVEYQKLLEDKARRQHRRTDEVCLYHQHERDIASRLEREAAALRMQGNEEAAQERERMSMPFRQTHKRGRMFYDRYCDFRLSVYWPLKKKWKEKIPAPYQEPAARNELLTNYLSRKHLARLRQMHKNHGSLLEKVQRMLESLQ